MCLIEGEENNKKNKSEIKEAEEIPIKRDKKDNTGTVKKGKTISINEKNITEDKATLRKFKGTHKYTAQSGTVQPKTIKK